MWIRLEVIRNLNFFSNVSVEKGYDESFVDNTEGSSVEPTFQPKVTLQKTCFWLTTRRMWNRMQVNRMPTRNRNNRY